jgi:hypothetical protein
MSVPEERLAALRLLGKWVRFRHDPGCVPALSGVHWVALVDGQNCVELLGLEEYGRFGAHLLEEVDEEEAKREVTRKEGGK